MSEWKEYKLGEVAIQVKDRIETSCLDSASYISTENMLPDKAGVTLSSGIPSGKAIMFKSNDILISNIRPYFKKIWRANRNGGCSSDVICLRALDIIEPLFLYYLLSQDLFFDYVMQGAKGTKMPRGDKKQILQWPVLLPSLPTQQKIAAILSSLDDKIAVNRKISDNLEQQAQALFKSWFVDFEPFKDGEFEESELGRIPKGWKVMSLTDIADYLNGLAMQKFRPSEGEKDLPVLKIKELGNGSCDSSSDRCSANISPEYIIENGDIIFSWSGTLLVDIWCGGRCGLNQHLFKVTSNNYPKWFYWLWTAKHLENFKFIARDKAVTMGHIKRSHLQEALVVVPNEETFKKADSIFAPIIDHIIESRIESRTLSQLRDTLLPKLMSGELKVNEI